MLLKKRARAIALFLENCGRNAILLVHLRSSALISGEIFPGFPRASTANPRRSQFLHSATLLSH
jgi:hypothetical protein